MHASQPFDPPHAEREAPSTTLVLVLGCWALAGAAAGTAIGTTLQVTSRTAGAGATWGIGGLAVAAVLGAVALAVERRRAGLRPELVDGSGGRSRPLHGALLGVPVLVAVPALAWLVVVGSLSIGSSVPAVAFGMAGVGVAWGGVRVWSGHRLARALEALEDGDPTDAIQALERLAHSPFAARGSKAAARLNLAQLALVDGDAEGALHWSDGLSGGMVGAWAGVVRALAHLLRRDPPEAAEEALAGALVSGGARAVQPEADAVRVLLVWRREGPAEARRLGEQLHGPAATPLHRALLAAARARTGDPEGAFALSGSDVDAVRSGALGRRIPELGPASVGTA